MTMPRKRMKTKGELISEERILQISNDLSEDMGSAKKWEYREVCRYWMREYSELFQNKNSLETRSILVSATLQRMAAELMGELPPAEHHARKVLDKARRGV